MHKIWMLVLSLSLLALTGCGNSKNTSASADSGGASGESRQNDPCSLLEPGEVEAAIGPLAGPPHREGNNGPDAEGDQCVYETKDLRSLKLDVTWSDGAMVMKMLAIPAGFAAQQGSGHKLPLPDGVTVEGEWDEVKALSCCEIDAMRGDQVVAIDFMNTRLTEQQGIALLNAALKRLEAPLKAIDGAAGIAAAEARAKSNVGRPKPIPACQLVTLADATEVLGPVEALPVGNTEKCQYRAKGKSALLDFSVNWTGGYRAARSDAEIAGRALQGMLGDLAKNPADVKTVEYPGPWEQAGMITSDFVAVRKDVQMRVDARGVTIAQAQAIVTKAMGHVAWPP